MTAAVRRVALVLAAAGALLAAGCADGDAGAPGPPAQQVGLVANTLGWGTQMGRMQDRIRATGVTLLREELSWYLVEPRRGTRRWRATDRLMVGAAHRHLQVLALLNGIPRWAGRPRGGLPTQTAAFGRYVRDVVARYGPDGTFWKVHPTLDRASAPVWFELWNEPFFAPPLRGLLDAQRYARLAAAGLRAGRAADAGARFLLAADVSPFGQTELAERWLDRLDRLDPSLLREADAVAVHPYSVDPAVGLHALDDLRARLLRRGHDLPIWVTEVGWSTCVDARALCVSEARQGRNLAAFLAGLRRRPATVFPKVFVYSLVDLRGGPADREANFGILRRDRSRKPAWTAVRRAAAGR